MKTLIIYALGLVLSVCAVFSESSSTYTEEEISAMDDEKKAAALNQTAEAFVNNSVLKAIEYANRAVRLARRFDQGKEIQKAFKILADAYSNSNKLDSAKYYYTALTNLSIRNKDSVCIGDGLSNIGKVHYQKSEYEKALRFYDSANVIYEKIGAESKLYGNYTNQATIKGLLGETGETIEILKRTRDYFEKENDEPKLAFVYNNLGYYFKAIGFYDSSMYCYDKSIEIAKKIKNNNLLYDNYKRKAQLEEIEGDIPKALDYYSQAKLIADSTGILRLIAASAKQIGLIYDRLGNDTLAYENYKQSYSTYEKLNDRKGIAACLVAIGDILTNRKEYDSAYKKITAGINILNDIGEPHSYAFGLTVLAKLYSEKSQLDSSITLLRKAYEILKDTGYKSELATAAGMLGALYLEKNENDKAIKFLKESVEIGEYLNNRQNLLNSYFSISSAYEIIGDFDKSLTYYKKYKEISDLVKRDEARLKMKNYEYEKKAAEDSLHTERLQRQNEKQRNFAYISAGGAFLTFIIGFVIFLRYRDKLKMSRALQNKNIQLETVNNELRVTGIEKDQLLKILNMEIDRAASYVISLINPPLDGEYIRTNWKFIPSRKLGGDCFGYHWIDDDHFAVYLIDVSGHGIGPALHAVSVMNLLSHENLTGIDFRKPAEVLTELNRLLRMDSYDGMFLTMWYMVYNKNSRELHYADAGHPPALMIENGVYKKLKVPNFVIGGDPQYEFSSGKIEIRPDTDLYVYSDGAYEIQKSGGEMMQIDDMIEFIKDNRNHDPVSNELDKLYHHLRGVQGGNKLEDDFSILKVTFK